jgi:lysine-N-methylase
VSGTGYRYALNRFNADENNYAFIKQKDDASCLFLNESGLCDIQLLLGQDALSNTCFAYPRITNEIDGIFEITANMSCPHAAKLALLNESPMKLNTIELQSEKRIAVHKIINLNNSKCIESQGHTPNRCGRIKNPKRARPRRAKLA